MPSGKIKRPRSTERTSGHRKGDPKLQQEQKYYIRKPYRDLNIAETLDPLEDKRKHDDKLLKELSYIIGDYSQQRMRALHMSLRQYGNDENRISNKDLAQSLQENNIVVPNVILKPLIAKFEGRRGINLEPLFKFLMKSHGRTGRDSVLAMHKRNDLEIRTEISREEQDEDLLWRIESQLIKSETCIDLQELRQELQTRDNSNCGKIDASLAKHICTELQLPVFGALLKSLIKRCDEEKNDKISWPEFIAFLERAQKIAKAKCPGLTSLPQRLQSKSPVEPSPLDELTDRTRQTIESTLRKKSFLIRSMRGSKDYEDDITMVSNGHHVEGDSHIPTSVGKQEVADKPALRTNVVDKSSEIPKANSHTFEGHTNSPKEKGTRKTTEPDTNANKDQNTSTSQKDTLPPSTVVNIDITVEEPSQRNTPIKTLSPVDHENPQEQSEENVIQTTAVKDTEVEASSRPYNNHAASKNDVQEAEASVQNGDEKDIVCETKTPDKENVEMATYQFGELKPDNIKGNEIEEIPEESPDKPMTVVTAEVRGKVLNLEIEKEVLDRQTLDPPTQRLKLQWVYGYRGNDCRKNIHTLATGEILYFISYVAIMYSKANHRQRHYREHTDDIKCIDVHSDKVIVASGQYANRKYTRIKAHVRIWRSDTLQTLHVLGEDMFEKSVACVTFAPNQDLLAIVDNSNDKKLTIWDTSKGTLKGTNLLHTDLVCDMGFNTKYSDILVTAGKEHICWWKVYPESDTVQPSAVAQYDNFLKAKFVICVAFTEKGDLITGDSNGTIYIFGDGGNKITNYVKHAHDGPVFTVLHSKGHVLSGGRDGIIHSWQWSKNMDSAGFLQIPRSEGGVRMFCVTHDSLLVGTTMNSVLIASVDDSLSLKGSQLQDVPLTQCHYDEVRGLATASQSKVDVFTAGVDGIICGFKTSERTSSSKAQFKGNQYVCIDTDCEGKLIVLGTKDGHVHIVERSGDGWTEILNRKICKDRLDCIRIAPDGLLFAAGSHDGSIYIFANLMKDDGTLVWDFSGILKGHTGAVNALDFSQCTINNGGYLLRSSSATLEVKHWHPVTLEAFKKKEVIANMSWMTQNILVDATTVGIMISRFATETDVTSLDVNKSRDLVVCATSAGNVGLFTYPCSLKRTYCHSYRAHANTHGVKFSACGKYLLTVGGRDSSLMQWEIV